MVYRVSCVWWAAALILLIPADVESAKDLQNLPIREHSLRERLSRGYGYFETGNLDEAKELFESAAQDWPDSAAAHRAHGVTSYQLGFYEKAGAAFEEVIRLRPDFAPAHARLGFVYNRLSLPKLAVESQMKAIALQPDLPAAHWGLGLAYKQLGFIEEAIAAFKKAISLRADFAEAHYDLAEACLIIKDNCTALEEYNLLKKLDKDLADKLFDLIYR